MIFNSALFLVAFVVFFPLYWFINDRFSHQVRNVFVIIASYSFYSCWDWRFLGLLIVSSAVDYFVGQQLGKPLPMKYKKALLAFSLITNLSILGFFKYFNFFLDSLNDFLSVLSVSVNLNALNILLPIGISFYTFQSISYSIDIYRGQLKPSTDVFSFFAFVSFFPQLVAGPIERANRTLVQFQERKQFNYSNSINGLRLFLWGMFQKITIADNFGLLADRIFDTAAPVSGFTTLIGALFFAFQIYADFAGYSNMAIGLSKLLGIELMTNFRSPYFATSLTNFWHRWHISLSTWFRDYVYIPLGGNRKGRWRSHLDLLITFLISGLWHGANLTFLIWGGLHGIFLLLEKEVCALPKRLWASGLVFILVTLLWIPFRAEDTKHFLLLGHSLFDFDTSSLLWLQQIIKDFSVVKFSGLMTILILFLAVEYQLKTQDFSDWIAKKKTAIRIGSYYLLLLLILLLGNFGLPPHFIYFQF